MNGFCKSLIYAACLLAASGSGQAQQLENCFATPQIFRGTTLANLADRYFGSVDYRYAILLATNTRSNSGFPFIGNPNDLPQGEKVCIPAITEAERLRNRFRSYVEAVQDMALPEPSERTTELSTIDTSKPVTTVSWVRADQAKRYIDNIGNTIEALRDTWVTLAPKVQEFCTRFAAEHGSDLAAITLRLEQRLGLPPHSAKTSYVELEVADPGDPANIFRPCESPNVTSPTCKLGPPAPCDPTSASYQQCHKHRDFFTNQYYTSYGVSLPTEYPWTSLGYTFDWARGPIGLDGKAGFKQYGEAEYVIAKGASVTVKGVYGTADYCKVK